MPNYKQMYLIMLDATERAMKIITDAQQRCEEIYIDAATINELPNDEYQFEVRPFDGVKVPTKQTKDE